MHTIEINLRMQYRKKRSRSLYTLAAVSQPNDKSVSIVVVARFLLFPESNTSNMKSNDNKK